MAEEPGTAVKLRPPAEECSFIPQLYLKRQYLNLVHTLSLHRTGWHHRVMSMGAILVLMILNPDDGSDLIPSSVLLATANPQWNSLMTPRQSSLDPLVYYSLFHSALPISVHLLSGLVCPDFLA